MNSIPDNIGKSLSEIMLEFIEKKTADVYWLVNKDLKTIYISPSVKTLRGVSQTIALNQTLDQVYTPESLEIIAKAIGDGLEQLEGKAGSIDTTLQLEIYCYDGNGNEYTKQVKLNCHGVCKGNGVIDYVEGITRDITDELEEEREKYLGGLCHAMSQPLQAISGFTDLMAISDDPEKLKSWAKKISEQMTIVNKIMGKLHRVREKTEQVKLRPYLNSVIVDLE